MFCPDSLNCGLKLQIHFIQAGDVHNFLKNLPEVIMKNRWEPFV